LFQLKIRKTKVNKKRVKKYGIKMRN
jgi:hypothetical protein